MNKRGELRRVLRLQIHFSLAELEPEPEAMRPTSKHLLALSYLMFRHVSGDDFTRVAAQDFNEGPWHDLVTEELALSKFIAWDRLQYSIQVTSKGVEVIVSNLTKACHAAASTGLLPLAVFLVKQMSREELPFFLSHDSKSLREAATERLNELT